MGNTKVKRHSNRTLSTASSALNTEAYKRYCAGLSAMKIAKAYNTSLRTVYRALKQSDADYKLRWDWAGDRRQMLLDYVLSGDSVKAVAKRWGVTPSFLWHLFLRMSPHYRLAARGAECAGARHAYKHCMKRGDTDGARRVKEWLNQNLEAFISQSCEDRAADALNSRILVYNDEVYQSS